MRTVYVYNPVIIIFGVFFFVLLNQAALCGHRILYQHYFYMQCRIVSVEATQQIWKQQVPSRICVKFDINGQLIFFFFEK